LSESPDSGTSAIASLFNGSGGLLGGLAAPDGPGIEADATVGLHIALGNLVSEMTAERMRKERLALDVSYLSAPAVSSGVLPFATPQWGPASGWAWAVQRITVAGFGATTDFVIAFRGNNANSDSVPDNALFTFQEAVAGGTATWHPGRTGLVLRGEESLVFGGTLTGGGQLVVSCDVIQLSMSKLPYFLL
jgi:hypothetical protein